MITIVSQQLQPEDELRPARWSCWLEVSRDEEIRAISATAPGELPEYELQAYFEGMDAAIWQIAIQERHEPDVVGYLQERELLRRLVKVMLSEINILREVAGLSPRTLEQLKRALKEARR